MVQCFKMSRIYYILSLLFLFSVFAPAQEDVQPREFKKEEWQRATKGIDYSDDVIKERKPKSKKDGANGNAQRPFKFGGNAAPVLKVLIVILLGVALFFLIRSLLGLNNPKNKVIKPVLSVEELAQLEENLHQADLEDFIRRALAEGNYALAVRLYYLAILKELSLKNLITWKKDKTNRDYLREMNRTPIAIPFSEITLIFERIWYGNLDLQQPDFEQLEPKFKIFIHQIETITTPVLK